LSVRGAWGGGLAETGGCASLGRVLRELRVAARVGHQTGVTLGVGRGLAEARRGIR